MDNAISYGCSIEIKDPNGKIVHTTQLEMDDFRIAIELGGSGVQMYTVRYYKGNQTIYTETLEVNFDE